MPTAVDTARLAAVYINSPDETDTPRVRGMARALAQRVRSEFNALPFRVEFTDHDPYGLAGSVAPELDQVATAVRSGKLWVFAGGSQSPLWEAEVNRQLRAVHDWHHVLSGAGFGLAGETRAFEHAANRYPLLAPLLYSEIVLQAAAMLHLGRFPEQQKVVLT